MLKLAVQYEDALGQVTEALTMATRDWILSRTCPLGSLRRKRTRPRTIRNAVAAGPGSGGDMEKLFLHSWQPATPLSRKVLRPIRVTVPTAYCGVSLM